MKKTRKRSDDQSDSMDTRPPPTKRATTTDDDTDQGEASFDCSRRFIAPQVELIDQPEETTPFNDIVREKVIRLSPEDIERLKVTFPSFLKIFN